IHPCSSYATSLSSDNLLFYIVIPRLVRCCCINREAYTPLPPLRGKVPRRGGWGGVKEDKTPMNTFESMPSLLEGGLHVWRAPLDLAKTELERLYSLLSRDEQERAERFAASQARTHFIAARAILRKILSAYVKTSAAELLFTYGEYGKP